MAHCGGNIAGSYLYALTLTDVATGWTECLPLLACTSEQVVNALARARTLFPFPILGLDTDNGSEFINEELMAYCEREHLIFTRGRPEQKNDQCYVEERNREVVRRLVGYNRLVGEQASQQLGELYRALRLFVNCFQPSMKLLSKTSWEEGKRMRCVYDAAKTPLQRLLLAGVLSASAQHELEDIAQALDPLALVDQVEQLQNAVFRCAIPSVSCRSSSFSPLPRRFAVEQCLAEPLPGIREEPDPGDLPTIPHEATHVLPLFLNWRRSSTNPFASAWERIYAWISAYPERSTRDLFEELQCRFPGRYTLSQYPALQRGVRKMRAHLRQQAEEPWPIEIIHGPLPDFSVPETGESYQEDSVQAVALCSLVSSQAPVDEASFPHPITAEEETTSLPERAAGFDEPRSLSSVEWPQQVMHASQPLAEEQAAFAILTVDLAIQSFLQELRTAGRKEKTLAWHQTALRSFQQYLTQRHCHHPRDMTTVQVRGWLAWLPVTPTAVGTHLRASTILSYARSARAFCAFLVRQGNLECTPFVKGTVPKAGHHPIQLIAPEEFERLLRACGPVGELMDHATARNRALLWLFLEMGLHVSEVRACCLEDLDRLQGSLSVRGNGAHVRHVSLGPTSLHALLTYVDQYRLAQAGTPSGKTEEMQLFLTETRHPLTAMTITQLFLRLNERAGFTEKHVSPSMLHDTFAIRFLQAGGALSALQEQLGLDDPVSVKRYQHFYKPLREEYTCKENLGHSAPQRMPGPRISSWRRKRPSSGST